MPTFNEKYNQKARDDWASFVSDYNERIKGFQGSEYYQELLNNPLLQFQQYSPTAGDEILNFFGMDSAVAGQDRFYQQRMDEVNNYLAQITEKAQLDSHNSTFSQVARDKAAGLNPALSGEVSSAGQASAMAPDETPPIPQDPGGEGASMLLGMAQSAFGFVTGIINMASSIQSLGISSIAAGSAQADMAKSMYDFILKDEAGNMPMPTKKDDGSYDYSSVPVETLAAVYKKGNRKNPFTGRAASLYKQLRGRILYDKEGRPTSALQRAWSKNVEEASASAKNAGLNMAMPDYSNMDDAEGFNKFIGTLGDTIVSWDLFISKCNAKLAEINLKVAKATGNAQISQAGYEADYYNSMDGQRAAQNDMAEFDMNDIQREVRRLQISFNKEMASFKEDLIRKVKGEGKWFNNLGMLMVPGLLNSFDTSAANLLSGIASVGKMIPGAVGKTAAAVDAFTRK